PVPVKLSLPAVPVKVAMPNLLEDPSPSRATLARDHQGRQPGAATLRPAGRERRGVRGRFIARRGFGLRRRLKDVSCWLPPSRPAFPGAALPALASLAKGGEVSLAAASESSARAENDTEGVRSMSVTGKRRSRSGFPSRAPYIPAHNSNA